jgi:hypothetical protein
MTTFSREISQSQGRYLHTGQHKQNKRTQISMLQMGFEPTIPVFERAKTVHASDPVATGIGTVRYIVTINVPEFLGEKKASLSRSENVSQCKIWLPDLCALKMEQKANKKLCLKGRCVLEWVEA